MENYTEKNLEHEMQTVILQKSRRVSQKLRYPLERGSLIYTDTRDDNLLGSMMGSPFFRPLPCMEHALR